MSAEQTSVFKASLDHEMLIREADLVGDVFTSVHVEDRVLSLEAIPFLANVHSITLDGLLCEATLSKWASDLSYRGEIGRCLTLRFSGQYNFTIQFVRGKVFSTTLSKASAPSILLNGEGV